MTKNDFRNLVISEAKQILLNEDISGELEQSNRSQGNHLQGHDEIGEFHIVVHPIEGDVIENVVKKVSIPHLLQKVKSGEMQVENIHSIYKKDSSATRQGKKILKEFNNSLQQRRKLQLERMVNKRKGYQMHLDGFKALSKGKEHTLDEGSMMKLKKLEELISKFDNNIADLQKKINENKKPINEGIDKKAQLRELFGFGKKTIDYRSPEEHTSDEKNKSEFDKKRKSDENEKYVAKLWSKNNEGHKIGQALVQDIKRIHYYEPYIQKLSVEAIRDILIECPKAIGWFKIVLPKIGGTYAYFVVKAHPELAKDFDEMNISYLKNNNGQKEQLKELFGFGSSAETKGMTPEEKKKYELDKRIAKSLFEHGGKGKEIGQYINMDEKWLKFFQPYFPKMTGRTIYNLLDEAPNLVGHFLDDIKLKKILDSSQLTQLARVHPELDKIFSQYGFNYHRLN